MAAKITYPVDKELTREQLYRHTVARGTSIKNLDAGEKIEVKEIVGYESDDGDKIISILDQENKHYVSSSKIFREELAKIVEIFGDTGFTIRICKEVSKQGRTYVSCDLA